MNEIYTLSEDKKTLIEINDKSITEFSIPEGVTRIESSYFGGAFGGCTSLQSIDIPNSVTEIGNYAFRGCTSLQSIFVAKDNTSLKSVDGVLYNINLTKIIRVPQNCPKSSFTIPNSVTEIGDWAFEGCTSLQSIDIPNSVTKIKYSAFSDCSSLQNIDIPNSVTEIWGWCF